MNKINKINRNKSFMFFISWLFLTSFELRSSPGEKFCSRNFFLKVF